MKNVTRRTRTGLAAAPWLIALSLGLAAGAGTAAATQPSTPDATVRSTAGTADSVATSATLDTCTGETPAARPEGQLRLVIGTGGTGGVFFPYGGGIARILSESMADTEATAEVTGGSVDNLNLLASNDLDFGFTTVDSAVDAVKGEGVYAEPIDLCVVASLYDSFIHVVASGDSGVTSVEQLAGRTVSVGSAGSSTEIAADRVMTTAGVDPKGITRENLSAAESVAAMKDGKIDAFFWIGGLPTAAVTDLTVTDSDVVFLPIGQYAAEMAATYGGSYQPMELPVGVYAGVDEAVPGIGVGNLLVTSPSTSSAVVAEALATLFDHLDQVHAVHPEAKAFDLETAASATALTYHPGAVQFFAGKGVTVGG